MKKLILIFIIIFSVTDMPALTKYELFCRKDLLLVSERIAQMQLGTIETKCQNKGNVYKYQIAAGIALGSPYCAAGQYYCFLKAVDCLNVDKANIPIPRTGLANNIYIYARKKGVKVPFQLNKHDLIIWRFKNSLHGHIERVVKVGKAGNVETIAFNVKSNDLKQCGVFIKKRNVYHVLGRMTVRGIVGFYSGENQNDRRNI